MPPRTRRLGAPFDGRAGVLVLDGPMGSELSARGVDTTLPAWSAPAVRTATETVKAIHRDYALAGAQLHTANTFRTQPRVLGREFEAAARRAVSLAREAVGDAPVAGSLAPVEDCYRPDLSPGESARDDHRALARVLADAGADLLLCETFPSTEEAWVAVEEACATGLPTWLALTAGPGADLMSPEDMAYAARGAVERGASRVLVNCVPASDTERFVSALRGSGAPTGAYANAGAPDERIGWRGADALSTARYTAFARRWIDRGATVVGGCCGTGPGHIRALRQAIGGGEDPRSG